MRNQRTKLTSRTRSQLILAFVLLGLAHGCAPPYATTAPEVFSEYAREHMIVVDGLELYYVEAGQPGKPLVLFVHGTPGSWHAFDSFLQDPRLVLNLHMIAVDRLGFGKSATSGPRPSFHDQARTISKLFERNQSGMKTLVVGHSLGGSIGARMAVDYPNDVGALLAISSAISPQLAQPRWYNHFADLPLVRSLLPKDLSVANEEVMLLTHELAAIEPRLRILAIPVTIIQGMQDKLVAPANADYVETTMNEATLQVMRFPDAGHFLIWEQPDVVTDEILRLVEELQTMMEQSSRWPVTLNNNA